MLKHLSVMATAMLLSICMEGSSNLPSQEVSDDSGTVSGVFNHYKQTRPNHIPESAWASAWSH